MDEGARRSKEERAAWKAKWGHHDHIADPQPYGDFNGFFDAVRGYARKRGLAMGEILESAGIFSIPATESYGETLFALRRVSVEELSMLPPQVQDALRRVREDLEKRFR